MADRDTVSRIAKILARATSDNPNEAEAALRGAHARMQRDGVTLNDLLALSEQELYQDVLVRLVELIVQSQSDLSAASRRELYARYLQMVVARFSHGTGAHESSREDESRREHKEYKSKGGNTPKQENGNSFYPGQMVFSFSPAVFFSFLRMAFGRGSFAWCVVCNPGRALRLIAASVLFGAAVAGVILVCIGVVHALIGVGPLWDVGLQFVFSFLTAAAGFWKARALYQKGWFS
ncbi:MAG: DUF2786 domain-containing protein [Burkholderiales bacterium]